MMKRRPDFLVAICEAAVVSYENLRISLNYNIATNHEVNLSLYRPWRPIGLREVEAPTFSDIQFIAGG
jgi:hypothetical protein